MQNNSQNNRFQNKLYQWMTQHPVWSLLFIAAIYCALVAALVFLPPIALYAPLISLATLNATTLLAINIAITATATIALSLITFFSLRRLTSPTSDILFSSGNPNRAYSSSFRNAPKVVNINHADIEYQFHPMRVLHNGDCGFFSVYCTTRDEVRNLFGPKATSAHLSQYRKKGIADLLKATPKQRKPLIDELIRCVFNPYIPGTNKNLFNAKIVSKGSNLVLAWYDAKSEFQETLMLFLSQYDRQQINNDSIESIRAGNYHTKLTSLIKKIGEICKIRPELISSDANCDEQLQQLIGALEKDESSHQYLENMRQLQQAKAVIDNAKGNVDEFLGNPDLQNEYITKKYQNNYLEAESARIIAAVNGYNLTIWDYDQKTRSYRYSVQNDQFEMPEAPNGQKHLSFSAAALEWNLLIPVEKSPKEKVEPAPSEVTIIFK